MTRGPENPNQDVHGTAAGLVDAVLAVVDLVPAGRVTTYGRVAALVRQQTGRGSARAVGRVLAGHGGETEWFRVVFADGRLPPDAVVAAAALAADGISVVAGRVDRLADVVWPERDPT